ncbi:hypothetical protein CAPTEDRAFT_94391 [Capitella teleta]|uniref:FAM234A/B beta-propeller domain-containing protein n=1 Tax=Capitella teleta TaxID=283909 RepID=R7U569_CAPTE|nr:hypothetical protein CAPTEDRAFT_94391 [Capitella teleta]|eukprot:ELU01119.1 hypothetical protein CAPTEDRAFT_94391 [Capitella teleta]
MLFVAFLALFAYFVVYLVNHYGNQWLLGNGTSSSAVIGCSRVEVEDVWVKGIPKLMTESAFRLLDVNRDGVMDILFGFATGGEGYNVPNIVCDIYFGGKHPCLGGLLALDGRTGEELWRHYTPHEIFSVTCEEDLNRDGQADCVIAGRVGTMEAVNSLNGQMLWNFTHSTERVDIMNLYTAQFIRDLDGDGVRNCNNSLFPGSQTRLSGKLLFFSGRTGRLLKSVPVPDERESYYSPVIYKIRDGTEIVLFGTGGETHPGSLWYISLMDLYKGDNSKAEQIYYNKQKGVMTPPVLIDLTNDGVRDIVFANYNSTVLALDGQTYRKLWNFSYPMSETYASPAPGFFNGDDVPDFMVHWQHGPGFPVYYHAISTVIDGATGQPLIKPYIRSSIGAQTSPLTISVEGKGNDIFLYWMADCLGHEGKGGQYDFVKGTNVHEKSRSDVCRLRFKSEGVTHLYALNQHLQNPGSIVYNSGMTIH